MTIQTPDDGRETASFKIADQKIENLLKRLNDKRVCPCCTARALTYHGASMAEHTMGSAEAIEMFEAIITACTRTTSQRPTRCLQRKRIEKSELLLSIVNKQTKVIEMVELSGRGGFG